ncbi:DUF7282 domain-containing protein [Salinimicrobium sp. GXAS 041]|uniref:DUF7282 domain-containing protein n=1 Tax=Salinimicrobium sp. GXAS 041 TaxID=3400806 RepID=UPI003C75FDBF
MKEVFKNIRNYPLFLGMLFLAFSLNSCGDDDDGLIDEDDETGFITAEDQTISGNTIVVQSVTVGQDSWLVAVHANEGNSDNFITDPVMIEEGTETNISLMLNEDANLEGDDDGDEITLKLYAEDDDGVSGEWDIEDEPVMNENGGLATITITVMMEPGNAGSFSDFDTNADGSLDADEFANTYANDFVGWDTDADGSLNDEEFFNTTFGNTDVDDDDAISEEEWNAGYTGMYSSYVNEDDFGTWDADTDGVLNSDEWYQGFGATDVYTTYDADANSAVTEDE